MISIVIPVFNSEKTIEELVNRISNIFQNKNYEIILINDDSTDATHQVCLEIFEKFSSLLSYVKLGKNVGEHNAVMAGLRIAEGDLILIMDDDLQTSPEEGLRLVEYAKENSFSVVYGKYNLKKHNFFRNLGSKINDLTANLVLKKPKNLYLNSFKCIKKELKQKIVEYSGPFTYIDGLILSLTSNIGILNIDHHERKLGRSQYTISKLIKLYLNIATNFSTYPIHLFSILGLLISILSSFYAIFIIVEKTINPNIPIGYSSILTAIFFFSGIQLIFLGLIGEYVGKIVKNVNQEPQYYIEFKKLRKK